MGDSSQHPSPEQILELLRSLQSRIERIETQLDLGTPAAVESAAASSVAAEDDEELEIELGQNWFAKAGIVGLALGIAFLLTLPYSGLPTFLPSAFGYVLVGVIFYLSHYWRDSFQQISRYLLGGGLLLLYFTTLRLFYFSPAPAITSKGLELAFLLIVVSANMVVAYRRSSMYLAGFDLTLGFLTALIGGGPVFVPVVLTLLCLALAYFSWKFQSFALLAFGTILTYTTHLLWTANNPFFTGEIQFGRVPEFHLGFVLVFAAIFASAILVRADRSKEGTGSSLNSALNAFTGFALLTLSTFAGPDIHVVAWQLAASVLFLAIAATFWLRERSVYSTFAYAMIGYAALSAAIAAQFHMPDLFIWLCWQSLLVVTTAVWFRSRFIVVANFIIYLIVFAAYLVFSSTLNAVSISFGIVALLSARVLNWQKDKLALRTELMRNAYLASALLFLPYALYNSVPAHFVSVSWLVLAALYYGASRLLRSRKYRWMALLTMSLTILYVFVIDLTTVDPAVRIVSFLAVGSALLAISMFYSKKKRDDGRANQP